MFFCFQSIEGWSESYIYLRDDTREAMVNRMTPVLAYMLGETLRCSELLENREIAQQYTQYSFDLAFKQGISLEEHLVAIRDLKSTPVQK